MRGELDERCILSEGNAQVSPVGHRKGNACVVERPVKDKKTGKTVRTEREEIPIGSPVFRDPQSGRVCLRDGAKGIATVRSFSTQNTTKHFPMVSEQAITVH